MKLKLPGCNIGGCLFNSVWFSTQTWFSGICYPLLFLLLSVVLWPCAGGIGVAGCSYFSPRKVTFLEKKKSNKIQTILLSKIIKFLRNTSPRKSLLFLAQSEMNAIGQPRSPQLYSFLSPPPRQIFMDLFWKVIIPFNLIFVISPSFDFGIDGLRYGLRWNRLWHRWISKLGQKQKPYCMDPKIQHRLIESRTKLWRATGTTLSPQHLLDSPPGNSSGKVKGCPSNDSFRNGLRRQDATSGQMSPRVLWL